MITVALVSSAAAAKATPCAWLPALAATTPALRSAWVSLLIRTYAPRALNDPVRCRFSHFRYTGPPTRSDSTRDWSSGVCSRTSPSTSRAAATSSKLTDIVMLEVWHRAESAESSVASPVAVRGEDERRRADKPRVLAKRCRHHREIAHERQLGVRVQRLLQRVEQDLPGLGPPAASRPRRPDGPERRRRPGPWP